MRNHAHKRGGGAKAKPRPLADTILGDGLPEVGGAGGGAGRSPSHFCYPSNQRMLRIEAPPTTCLIWS